MVSYNYSVAIVPLEPDNDEMLNHPTHGGKIIHVEKVGLRQVKLEAGTKMVDLYKVLLEYETN